MVIPGLRDSEDGINIFMFSHGIGVVSSLEILGMTFEILDDIPEGC